MSLGIRIRAWRTRWNERKAEKVALNPQDSAGAKRLRDDYLNRQETTGFDAGFTKHAGQEGRNHY